MQTLRARRRLLPRAQASDAKRAAVAASLQRTCPCWLVMFSRWHQTYTAFACFTAGPVIVDEPTADAFLARIRQVELECASGQGARG